MQEYFAHIETSDFDQARMLQVLFTHTGTTDLDQKPFTENIFIKYLEAMMKLVYFL